VVNTDPEWEAINAARSNIDHDDAVQVSERLLKAFRSQWRSHVPPSPVDVYQIIRTLTEKKIPFVLTGAYAIGGWTGRPRSTQDVDILTRGDRNQARAVKALKELYPQLEVRTVHGVVAFFIPGEKESVIDVTYPHRADIAETLAHPVWTENKERGLRYRIPSLEAALANKYGAMVTPTRNPQKRMMDGVDFGWMVLHSMDEGQKPIDLERLAVLGELAWPGGGGLEILRLVEQVKAGQQLQIDIMGRFAGQEPSK
jgi:hypothetical protein